MAADNEKLMFRQLGQVGFNVSDLDKTVEYYAEVFGINPYVFIDKYDMKIFKAKLVWYGWDAPTAVELIQVISEKEEFASELDGRCKLLWSNFLTQKGQGVHHVAFPVEDLDEELRRFKELGVEELVRDPQKPPGWAFIDTTKFGGTVFELVVGSRWHLHQTVSVRKSKENEKLAPTRMSHVGIVVEDMEKTLKYWEDTLGKKPTLYIPEYGTGLGRAKSAIYDFPEGLVTWELGEATWVKPDLKEQDRRIINAFEPERGDEANHIAFGVDDMARELDRLKKRGIQELIRDPNTPPEWCYLDTRKQAGVKIEIALRPELKYRKEEGKIHRILKV